MTDNVQQKAKNLLESYNELPSRKVIDEWITEIEDRLEAEDVGLAYRGYSLKKPGVVSIDFQAFDVDSFQRALSVNLSYALFKKFAIRCIYVQGNEDEKTVTFEVPYGKVRCAIGLKDLITDEWLSDKDSKFTLPIGMGKEPFYYEVSKMPNLAICGASGTGKSVFVHSLLISLAIKYTPEEVNFVLFDPKMVEFTQYRGLPHLYTDVITANDEFATVLEKLNGEIEARFNAFSALGVMTVDDYNQKAKQSGDKPFSKIIVVCDEVLDLICFNRLLARALTMMLKRCRAAGIYFIVTLQPRFGDYGVLEFLENFPCKVAFRLFSMEDCYDFIKSSLPFNFNKAGEMLLLDASNREITLQGAYVDVKEIDKIISFLKEAYGR